MVKTIGAKETLSLGLELLTSDPSTPETGQMWYNTTDNKARFYDGSSVVDL